MKVRIIGSGITGITTAYYLAKNNHQVTIADERSIDSFVFVLDLMNLFKINLQCMLFLIEFKQTLLINEISF